MSRLKNFNNFIFEGKDEMDKIDELMDIMNTRKLTPEESDLLKRLSRGEKLPEKEKPKLVMKPSGAGYLLDDEGNPVVKRTIEPETEDDKAFVTSKGKNKIVEPINNKSIIARAYKNKESDDIYIFANIKNKWFVYRTRITKESPYGQFLNLDSPKQAFIKNSTPIQLWKILDMDFDYGMEFDNKLKDDFIDFIRLWDEDIKDSKFAKIFKRENKKLISYRNKFYSLL